MKPSALLLLTPVLFQLPFQGEVARELTGRFLDEDGAVVASAELTCAIAVEFDGRRWNQRVLLATDAAGRFRIEVLPWEGDGVLVVRDSGQERGFRLDLAGLEADANDLGDVTLARAPVLATGQVLDESGDPAVRCLVQVDEPLSHRIGEEPSWSRVGHGQTDATGSFELRGWTACPQVRVQARRGRQTSNGPVIEPGAADLTLSLGGVGQIAGRVAAPFPLLHGAVQVAASRSGRPRLSTVPVRETGDFLFGDLPVGVYDLELEGAVLGETLRRIQQVTVNAGVPTEDARLQDVDLTRSIRTVTVSVTDEARDPLHHFLVYARRGDAEWRSGWHTSAFQVVTIQPFPVELALSKPGHRNLSLGAVDRDLDLILPAGLPVLAVLDGGLPDLEAGFRLRAQVLTRSPIPNHGARSVDLDEEGSALLRASDPGPAEVVVYLVKNESPVLYEYGPAVVAGHVLQLEETTEVREVRLRIEPSRLRRLMDEAMQEDD